MKILRRKACQHPTELPAWIAQQFGTDPYGNPITRHCGACGQEI